MHEDTVYVRLRFPWAEAVIQGGTDETAARGSGTAMGVLEKWVIFSQSGFDATVLGEGQTLEAAWADAARKLRSRLS
jgi:hypothetical protein